MSKILEIVVEDLDVDNSSQKIVFTGDFDKAGFSEIKDELMKVVETFQGKFLIFDFKALNFINSEGIGHLMEFHAQLDSQDKMLVIIGPKANVRDVFEAVGLDKIISLYNSYEDYSKKHN